MKKIISSIILLLSVATYSIFAIPAYNKPVQVIQPDGSTITIEIHGDEFLNWKTYAGRQVEQAKDGFFYFASFDMNGDILISKTKVNASSASLGAAFGGEVKPPLAAIQKANLKREEMARQKSISMGSHKFLTILVEFPNLKFIHPKESFENLLNEDGYSVNGATGSAMNYYSENSDKKFDPEYIIAGPYTVSEDYEYYGQNGSNGDKRAQELFIEAVRLADEDIDFSEYDADNDGHVDNIFFYYAGHNEAEGGPSNTIWPHKWVMFKDDVYVDGKKAYGYACTSELKGSSGETICGIGTFCHEFGHVLGLPDFYDTDYNTNGNGAALGPYSLMSSGGYNNGGNTPPYFNSEERRMLGWMEAPTELTESGEYTLEPINKNKAYVTPTNNNGEYFLYESRGGTGWDEPLPTGMIIYHVDKSTNNVKGSTAKRRWDSGNGINAVAAHQCFDIEEAGGRENYRKASEIIYPGSTNNTEFSLYSTPAAINWEGEHTGYDITNITDNGEAGVSFTLTKGDSKELYSVFIENKINAIKIPKTLKKDSYLPLELVKASEEKIETIKWIYDGEELSASKTKVLLKEGEHTLKVEIKYSDKTEIISQI